MTEAVPVGVAVIKRLEQRDDVVVGQQDPVEGVRRRHQIVAAAGIDDAVDQRVDDRANRSQLVLTLRTYLRDRNKNRTAQVLFIHRQTLAYRLRKIREITHRDLEDPDDLLALQLGLLADSLLSR